MPTSAVIVAALLTAQPVAFQTAPVALAELARAAAPAQAAAGLTIVANGVAIPLPADVAARVIRNETSNTDAQSSVQAQTALRLTVALQTH